MVLSLVISSLLLSTGGLALSYSFSSSSSLRWLSVEVAYSSPSPFILKRLAKLSSSSSDYIICTVWRKKYSVTVRSITTMYMYM